MKYHEERERLVKHLKNSGYINTDKVYDAMNKVPRHIFLPDNLKDHAYVDSPQPIGGGQTISAPHMVAMMVEALDLDIGQRVLEIGGGRGYHAAVIAELVGKEGQVYTVELIEGLAKEARKNLRDASYSNVKVILGDGSKGYSKEAPYHRISVACGAPAVPPPMLEQLKVGGKLLIPLGGSFHQELLLFTKTMEGKIKKKGLGGVLFVPLRGEHGF